MTRFGYVMGDAARVAMALYQFALDHLASAGFTPVITPVLVREEAMYGTGFFPTERSNIYALEADGLAYPCRCSRADVERAGLLLRGWQQVMKLFGK